MKTLKVLRGFCQPELSIILEDEATATTQDQTYKLEAAFIHSALSYHLPGGTWHELEKLFRGKK